MLRCRARAWRGYTNHRGFTYLTALFVVALLGGGLALAGEVWHTQSLREKEAELLHIGNQYRRAIERYHASPPLQYPRTLGDLLKDPRKPGIERYLRKLYADPITGKTEWGLVKLPDGGIMGVHSLSEDKPFKAAGFNAPYESFANAEKYSDWKFAHAPLTVQQAPLQQPQQPPVTGR